MLHVIESEKTVQEIRKILPGIVAAHKFGVLGEHNLREKMNEKGIPFERDCIVFEVCSPLNAKAVLEADMAISTALPCRISVYRNGGKTMLATLSPVALLSLFGKPELKHVAEEVEQALFSIMDAAAGA